MARGYCEKHYNRWRRHGSPTTLLIEQHGLTGSLEYQSWYAMKDRCYNKNFSQFADYGGRGIEVCDRWKNSFSNFLEDMGKRPEPNYSIDRIDTNGNYEPSNCRWASPHQQSINKRLSKSNKSGRKGVFWLEKRKKWLAYITLNRKRIHLGHFIDFEDAAEARYRAEIKYFEKVVS